MTINLSIRKLISSWLKSGYDAPTIYALLNKTVSRATMFRWVNRISKSGIMAATSPGRPRSVRTKGFIAKVKRNVSKNQKRKSARQIAREEGCDQRTVRVAIRQGLSFKAYKRIPVPDLTDDHIAQRYSFSHWIKNNFTRERCFSTMFSDEKCFDTYGQLNRQNDRVYARSRQEANKNGGLRSTKKFPAKVMVWVGLTINGICEVVVLPAKSA